MSACLAVHGCITCGDEAIPMRALRVDRGRGLALCCDPEGERCSVEIALVEPVAPGEVLLVHAGTALGRAADPALGRAAGPVLGHAAPAALLAPPIVPASRVLAGSRVLDAAERERSN